MSIIDKIIDELVDPSKSLMGPILNTKVIASQIGNAEIAKWADDESTGYRDRFEEIPDYRVVRPVDLSTYRQGSIVKENVPLPLLIFDEDLRRRFFTSRLEESVSTLEVIAERAKEGGPARKNYAEDICQTLTRQIQNNDRAPIKILSLTRLTDPSEYVQVLAGIRSKLLDFVLKLKTEAPDLVEALKEYQPVDTEEKGRVGTIFQNVFHITGNNNTITSGNDNTVQK